MRLLTSDTCGVGWIMCQESMDWELGMRLDYALAVQRMGNDPGLPHSPHVQIQDSRIKVWLK